MLNRKCTICSVSKPFSKDTASFSKSEHIADIFLGTCPTIVEDSDFVTATAYIGVTDVAGLSDTRQVFSNFSLPNALIFVSHGSSPPQHSFVVHADIVSLCLTLPAMISTHV